MLKGHTYTGLDQSFNTMMSHLKQFAIYTISKLVKAIWRALKAYNCVRVIELHALWDWCGYFEPHIHERFGGFATSQFGSGMHEFRARMDSDGVVRVWFRRSSQASSWEPEGPGYPVFTSVPLGEPALAPAAKSDSKWRRIEVEGTLRQWFQFMHVKDQDEAEAIRKEWGEVFKRLPTDGDPNHLAPELKPKWGVLPICAARTPFTGRATSLDAVSSHMENPPINPITGLGRTAAEVQREVAAYRAVLRQRESSSENPAVFQGDYLFVQLAGKSLMLARVAHGCSMEEATSPEITFAVGEYNHEPQDGVLGFLGTFTKKLNEAHNPADKRTGNKFVKHLHVTRGDIVMYDVRTFVDRLKLAENAANELPHTDCLRIAPISLLKLAALRPEFPCPNVWPPSHKKVREAEQREQDEHAQWEAEGDDPPPPIPDNFEAVTWELGTAVKHFLLWTKVAGVDTIEKWHQAVVTKTFTRKVRGDYTHDAKFEDGKVRGMHPLYSR